MKKISLLNPFLPALLITLIFSGCSDEFFNREAGDRITPDQHYQSLIDANVSLQGAIISLQEAMPKLVVLDGLRSDELDVTPYSGMDMKEINDHNISPGNPFADPSDLYKVIVNVNEVLANIDRVALNDRNFDEYNTKYYKGALIGMRSWAYLTIARLFNQAVYISDNLATLQEDLAQHVLSKDILLDTLINQLIPYIHDDSQGTQLEELRISHFVNTKALLGELYLEKGDYSNAVLYLKMACESYGNESSLLKVDNTYSNAGWSNIFFNAETQDVENISVIPFNSIENQYNPLAGWFGYTYEYNLKPSDILVDTFMTQIPTSGAPGDLYRGLGISFGVDTVSKTSETEFVTESYVTKYEVQANEPFSSDVIISRAADIHLLLAEAYNRLGDDVSQEYALMLLNQGVNRENPKPPPFSKWSRNLGVRGRVNLESKEIPDNITGNDKIQMIEDLIITERSMELAFEGKRWVDLVRIAERRGDPAYLADRVAAKFAGTPQYDEIHARLMNPANWYLTAE